MLPGRNNSDFTSSGTKTRIFVLFLFIILVGGMIFYSFNKRFSAPFALELNDYNNQIREAIKQDQADAERVTQEMQKDTDGDGITDYDEVNIYTTNPYLVDSDGDDISDKVEIDEKRNPLCPEGSECLPFGTESDTTLASAEDQLVNSLLSTPNFDPNTLKESNPALYEKYIALAGNKDILQTFDVDAYFNQIGSKQIREFMVQSGVSQAEVDALTDDALKAKVKQIFNQMISR